MHKTAITIHTFQLTTMHTRTLKLTRQLMKQYRMSMTSTLLTLKVKVFPLQAELSDATEKIPSDTTGDGSRDLPTNSANI
jgi:hypothetical protein